MSSLRVGVVADSPLRLASLQHMVRAAGHRLMISLDVTAGRAAVLEQAQQVDAWVIDSDATDDPETGAADDAVICLLEQSGVPVLLAHSHDLEPGSSAYADWLRRMAERLDRLCGDVNLQGCDTAPWVWILAASTGGPAAVRDFLAEVQPGLGIAFVYVQHIDAGYTGTLLQMMGKAGHYPAFRAVHGSVLRSDSLLLIDPAERVELLENATFRAMREPWGGDYAPSVDQVAANIARLYRQRCGLIVFSGMGDDGAAGSRHVRQRGGAVWVQSPSCCTSTSMPEAVLSSMAVDFQGSPGALARHLNNTMKNRNFYRKVLP